MNPQSLLASAGINIGLALVVLSLFSVLKKQRSTAPVYYSRRLAAGEEPSFPEGFSGDRILPSVSWIQRALRISDDDILRQCGLDALAVIRLFKFGIKFFMVCSVIGLLILLPVNYTCEQDPSRSSTSHSMDSLTISNIKRGSNRLWVHFSCLCFISFFALYLLYKEYKWMLHLRIQQMVNQRHRPDQFTVVVRGIPFCAEHKAHGCCVDHFFSKYHPHAYRACQIVYDGKNIEDLLYLASSYERKLKNLKQKAAKRHTRESCFCDMFQPNIGHIDLYEERLQDVCRRIRLLQHQIYHPQKELPAAFVSFKSRCGAALAANTQQHLHPLLWITEQAPEPRDVIWNNLAIPYRHLVLHKVVVCTGAFVLTVFFAFPVTAVQGIVQFEKIKKWFPPVRAVQLIPGLSSILTGYLPSAILNGFIYLVPYAMLSMATLEGWVSRSKKEIKTCSMVFYFLVGNLFFLSLLSGSLLDQIGESFTHPKDFPSHLAGAVSAQADFFITYIMTDGFSGFSLEILQVGLLLWHYSFGKGTNKEPYLYGFPYYRVIPVVSLAVLIGMVYAVVAPLLLPFLILYFLLGYTVYVNQMQDVYEITYETYGQYWPCMHHYIFIAIILMQITMIGLFGLKSKPGASIATVVLVTLTIFFNEYCKVRFVPAFCHFAIQHAKDIDDIDEAEGQMEVNRQNAINAYRPPWMCPVNFTDECSSTEPLISS